MKNLILFSVVLFSMCMSSCSKEEIDISGNYKLIALVRACDNQGLNLDIVEGDNDVLGTNVNFTGTLLFTVGGVFKVDYDLASSFASEDVYIEGTYSITDDNFKVCGNNGCNDNSLPSGLNQITMSVQEGDCLLTLTGERI